MEQRRPLMSVHLNDVHTHVATQKMLLLAMQSECHCDLYHSVLAGTHYPA